MHHLTSSLIILLASIAACGGNPATPAIDANPAIDGSTPIPVDAPVDGGTPEQACADGADDDGDGYTDCDDLDCVAATSCAGSCPVIPTPATVLDRPLPDEAVLGTFESVTAGSFHDEYLFNGSKQLKVGVRREWGGTIVFFGQHTGAQGMNASNVIDANDTGREVQVAFYDRDRAMQNCAWNQSCVTTPTTCPFSITYLGWNPVQGGNRCNRGSGVEAVSSQAGVLSVTTLPLFWNPNWDRADCVEQACSDPALNMRRSDVRVTQTLRFVREHVVELEYVVTNLTATSHAPTIQEFPTIYPSNGGNGTQDLWRLFNSAGAEVAIDVPANDGFNVRDFTSPAGWVTMQNSALNYGVGLYNESRETSWQGWQQRALPFNNFRPQLEFGIPALGTVRGRSYLLLGSQSTISSEAQWLDANLAPFGVLDAPVANAALAGVVEVRGWALDNKGISSMQLRIDRQTTVPLTYGDQRPDVCAVWPGYPACTAVGYHGTVDAGTLTACAHLFEVVAVDTDGNSRVIARRRVTVAP